MHMIFNNVVISLIAVYCNLAQGHIGYDDFFETFHVEGYLISKLDNGAYDEACVIQLSDYQEGLKFITNETGLGEQGCDLLVLTPGDNATYDQGGFSIQFKKSGKYLYLAEYHFSLKDQPQELLAYRHDDLTRPGGMVDLVNATNVTDSVHLMANGGLGWRCLYSYLYYAEYYDDEYGYLSAYATNTGAVDCNYDYWFVEVNSTYYYPHYFDELEDDNSGSQLQITIQCMVLSLALLLMYGI